MRLEDQIAAFAPENEIETAHQRRILAHVRSGGSLFDRRRWDGHLTGSAFVVDDEGRRLLLIHHRKLQKFLQPGGHGEPTETDPFAVALREANEETGLVGLTAHEAFPRPFDLDVHDIPARRDEPAHQHLDVRYVFRAPRASTLALQAEEIEGARWVTFTEAAAIGDESVARAARKIARVLGR